MTVRTEEEDDVTVTGTGAEPFSFLDFTEATRFFIGGAPATSEVRFEIIFRVAIKPSRIRLIKRESITQFPGLYQSL